MYLEYTLCEQMSSFYYLPDENKSTGIQHAYYIHSTVPINSVKRYILS